MMIDPMARADGWEGFRLTLLDEGGSDELWLWEVLADAPNFFGDSSRKEQLAAAERLIRELLDGGWAFLAWPDGTRVSSVEAESEITRGRWREFPPAPEGDVRLIPTAKWRRWSAEARN